jgi:hypothetical protein
LVESISKVTDKCFVWTHYYDKAHYPGVPREVCFDPRYPGVKIHSKENKDMDSGRFWGGNRSISVWLDRDDLISTFHRVGFHKIDIVSEDVDHIHGACLSFAARRQIS